ncbi:hypothetical protein RhiirA4_468305 [Rhizophagus irregularis]|uniref:Uncharacterized protein n=1 Tax=Rhizophagus irregularis TaxID=588596 RepID=A0A2I1GXI7_9GLOM|nr:hypothetical protein RhiirA4_468305 [Rhizophagus irregularis]
MKNNEIEIIDGDEREYRETINLKKKMREMINDKKIIQTINHKFEIIDSALLTNDYNLFWKKQIITGGFRQWRKKVTDAIWKNELLNSEKLNDLFMYNFKKEFDWQSTLEFISNRINFTQRQCNEKDTRERSYRIKNLCKELPTYEILFRRDVNKIDNPFCRRCDKKEEETWEHMWICEDNEFKIEEIAQESIYRYEKWLEENDRNDEVKILRKFNFDFIRIIEQPSIILLGKNRIWEIVRGVYNNNFNKLSNLKEEKALIKNLWNFLYEELKNRIWIPRCDEVKRIEEKEGIMKSDLKKKRKENEEKTKEEKEKNKKIRKTQEKSDKINKNNKNISIVSSDVKQAQRNNYRWT